MIKIIAEIFIILVLAVLVNACKNNSTNPPPSVDNTNYFPNGDGSTYSYSVEKTDSNGTQTAGTRNITFAGTQILANTTYQVQIDSLNLSGIGEISFSYFRKASDGVFYYLDTTGLTSFIPPNYLSYLTIDSELRELLFPLKAGTSWPVFRITIISTPILALSVVDVEAAYDATESLTLHLTSGDITKEATKVKYTFNLVNPANSSISSFSAYAWFVDGIGAVMWQGNAALLNAFAGGRIDLADTSSVITQSLVSYNITQ